MKLLWIISIFIVILKSSRADISEDVIKSRNLSYNARSVLDNTEIKDELPENDNNPVAVKPAEVPRTSRRRMNVKDSSKPKKEPKHQHDVRNGPSFVISTRRPLMKTRRYTSKPHEVHNVEWQTSGQQSNYRNLRNPHTRKQFRPKNRIAHRHNKVKHNVENPFKDFKTVDKSDEIEVQPRNKNSISLKSRIEASASDLKTVTIRPSSNNNNNNENLRRKANAEIQKALQHVKGIRQDLKSMPMTVNHHSINENSNSEVSMVKADEQDVNNKKVIRNKASSVSETIEITGEQNIDYEGNETKRKSLKPLSAELTENMEALLTKKLDADATERRPRRAVNIIEEEHSATTLTGIKYTGHESMGLEFYYRNIHT